MKNIPFSNSKSCGQKNTNFFAAFILGVVLAGLTSGCVFIPTPHFYADGSRQNVTEQSTNLIQPGVDTIESLMMKFGEPDAISPDEHRFAYDSKKIVGELFVVGVDRDGSDLPDVTQYRFLNVMVDGKSIVTNRDFSRQQISMLVGSIGGEEIKFSSRAVWFPETNPDKPSNGWSAIRSVSGNLILTESTLYFFETTQLLNNQPTLYLRYGSVAECYLDKHDYGPSLTFLVRGKDNHLHSFDLHSKNAAPFCEFIQSKINSIQPAK